MLSRQNDVEGDLELGESVLGERVLDKMLMIPSKVFNSAVVMRQLLL